MNKKSMPAYAKVNLSLDVIGKRSDGYHELDGVMHSIDLFDYVTVEKSSGGIEVICNVELPHDNTAYRAAKLYFEHIGTEAGAIITIDKRIPSEAGLGGASADAAAVLRLLNELYTHTCDDSLYEIGKKVGADVPFCLHGGCARAGGIGEKLTALPGQKLMLLLVKGNYGISTKELFNICDSYLTYEGKKTTDLVLACKEKCFDGICKNAHNMLEEAAQTVCSDIDKIKTRLIKLDASAALMTGSGSTVYGIFDSEAKINAAYDAMCAFGYDFVRIARTVY